MTAYKGYYVLSADGHTKIHVNCRQPKQVAGVVQIAHGIAEYGRRYDAFAGYLCKHGFAVAANDHLGHGLSIAGGQPPLFFSEDNVGACLRDSRCGGKISAGLMQDLPEGLRLITRKKDLQSMDVYADVLSWLRGRSCFTEGQGDGYES